MRKLFSTLAFFSILFTTALTHASGVLHTDGKYFKDAQNRVVLLRGVNVSNASKVPPFHPLTDLGQLDWIRDFGLNNIRLLFVWEAYELEPGQYNDAYLEELGRVVEAASARGIHTVVDFHSDSFSRYLIKGCGSGFPRWTLPPDIEPATPDNGQKCKYWGLTAASSYVKHGQVARMAQSFFSDETGARTRFLLAWQRIARFFSRYPDVIGYDVFNEPFGDEVTEVAPLYEDAARIIRQEDPQAILFLEPSVMTVNGLSLTALPKPPLKNIAYAGHNYDPAILGFQTWRTGGTFLERGLNDILKTAQEWNVPIYIGEFGAAGEGHKLQEAVAFNYLRYNQNFLSAAQWSFTPSWNPIEKDGWDVEDMSIVDQLGNIRSNFWVRPYAKEIAGEPVRMNLVGGNPYEPMTLFLEWKHDPKKGSTRIFFPETIQKSTGKLEIEVLTDSPRDPELQCERDGDGLHIVCTSPKPGEKRVLVTRTPTFRWN